MRLIQAMLALIVLMLGMIYYQSSDDELYQLVYTHESGSDYIQDYNLTYADCIYHTWEDPRWRCERTN
jgi:hypothetical protein